LAQVNLQQPQESKLLVKSITAHDPQARVAPLNGRQMAAYHTLEDWVQTTLTSNPHLRERTPQAAPAAEAKAIAAPPSAGFAAARPRRYLFDSNLPSRAGVLSMRGKPSSHPNRDRIACRLLPRVRQATG